ncbi:MAG: hypothetical protein QM802_13145 [Agriterribacter sp.]
MSGLYQKYTKLIGADHLFERSAENVQVTGQPASDLIRDKILEGKPLMIARFGSTELNCMLNYYFINQGFLTNVKNIVSGIPYFLKLKENIMDHMKMSSGFFPATKEYIMRFCKMSLEDLPEIDILGSWMKQERYLYKYFKYDHVRVRLGDITPLRHTHPWSIALEGKKVLIVHPFEDTIISQYKRRTLLFKDERMLPAFELKTLKAVQSIVGTKTAFNDWFEALDYMKNKIEAIDFDIAILGCGAYGMPLAAHIKRMGKQAIHFGGETQTLFGIKGKRWEDAIYNYHNKFYNDYWVRPSNNEKPQDANKMENGAYW